MSISAGFIRKPIATALLTVGITLVGLLAFAAAGRRSTNHGLVGRNAA